MSCSNERPRRLGEMEAGPPAPPAAAAAAPGAAASVPAGLPVGADFSMVVAPLPSGAPPVLEHEKRPLPPHPSFDDESRPAVKARKDPVPYGDPGGAGGRKPCGCKNSKCLKLYCDCFAIGEYCKGCLCVGCHNNVAFEQERQHAMDQIRKKDKTAFTQKVTLQGGHLSGCNCTKSRCLKRYCECFRGGVPCGIKCRCVDCGNTFGTCPRGGDGASMAAAAEPYVDEMRAAAPAASSKELAARGGPVARHRLPGAVAGAHATLADGGGAMDDSLPTGTTGTATANGAGDSDDESIGDATNLLVDDGNPEAYPHEGLCTVKLGKRQLLWPCWLTPAVAGALNRRKRLVYVYGVREPRWVSPDTLVGMWSVMRGIATAQQQPIARSLAHSDGAGDGGSISSCNENVIPQEAWLEANARLKCSEVPPHSAANLRAACAQTISAPSSLGVCVIPSPGVYPDALAIRA